MPLRARLALAVVVSMFALACTDTAARTASAPPSSATAGTSAPPSDDPTPFYWDRAARDLPAPATSIDLDEILSGGPPVDGIPPIDAPKYVTQDDADEWLVDREPVMLVERNGEARIYPLRILTFHEIVNDTLGGEPTLVTYCPLCNSALAFDPVIDGQTFDFGTSGRLYRSNLVMYDRQTHSLWLQFVGEAVVGDLLGTTLDRLPVSTVSWADAKAGRPDADVLSQDTGVARPYGNNPYTGYDSGQPFLFNGPTDDRLPQITRVVTVGGDTDPVAFTLPALRERRVLTDTVDDAQIVVFWQPGTASALDTRALAEGADVGASGVFSPIVDGQTLTFSADGDYGFIDDQTSSRWTLLGTAVEGPLEGTQLDAIIHDDTFWFVQYAFQPESRVVGTAEGT